MYHMYNIYDNTYVLHNLFINQLPRIHIWFEYSKRERDLYDIEKYILKWFNDFTLIAGTTQTEQSDVEARKLNFELLNNVNGCAN